MSARPNAAAIVLINATSCGIGAPPLRESTVRGHRLNEPGRPTTGRDHATGRDRAVRALQVSMTIGSTEIAITPMITRPKFYFTTGWLPKK
jgi:hypothetical protein